MRTTNIKKARALANSLYQKCNEGASYNSKFDSPKWGYMVSLKDGPVFDTITGVDTGKVTAFIEENLPSMDFPLFYFGVWIDSETGKVYFDLAEQFANLDNARGAAQARDQIAIYDVDNKEDIRI